jgi:hypothetical protein
MEWLTQLTVKAKAETERLFSYKITTQRPVPATGLCPAESSHLVRPGLSTQLASKCKTSIKPQVYSQPQRDTMTNKMNNTNITPVLVKKPPTCDTLIPPILLY